MLFCSSNYDTLKLFLMRYVFQTVMYHIWRERNNRRHRELSSPTVGIMKLVDKTVQNKLSAIRLASDISYNDGLVMWFVAQTS